MLRRDPTASQQINLVSGTGVGCVYFRTRVCSHSRRHRVLVCGVGLGFAVFVC